MAATTPQIDYSLDWRFWSNTESVTVNTTAAGGSAGTPIVVSDAFRGDIDRDSNAWMDLLITAETQFWSVPASLMGSTQFREGSVIVDASSVSWLVTGAKLVSVGNSALYWLVATVRKR